MRRSHLKRSHWQAIQAEFATWRKGALPGVIVLVGVGVARCNGSLQFLELAMLDNCLRLRPAEPMDERVVIVGVTEADIQRTKTYPIPDSEFAALLQRLQTYQPAAIGLDIVRDLAVAPGHAALADVFRTSRNIIGVEIALPDRSGFTVAPPAALPAVQIGFADTVLDADGYQRRSLLGAHDAQQNYRFAMTLRLAERYLARQGLELSNGIRDPDAMRFGNLELTRVRPNSGGYVGADAGGNQILLNVRSGTTPFRVLSMAQIQAGVNPAWLRGHIVLIGMMSFSAKDLASSGAIAGINPGRIYGVEMQAHAVSQIISAALNQRPLLQSWSDGWEYLWIALWGVLGISLGRFLRSPWKLLLGLAIAITSLIGVCYGFLLWGWWLPLVPALLALVLNGAGLTAALFYRHEQSLRLRLEERQFVIEQTFNAIHSGPLQTLTSILRTARQEEMPLLTPLERLQQELRSIYGSINQATADDQLHLRLGGEIELALQAPLHELLYKIYCNTLERDLPYLKTAKCKIVQFDPLDTQYLRLEHKRGLCRFLEEALCNVGKYAEGATRLTVICTQEGKQQVIRVTDNGKAQSTIPNPQFKTPKPGLGTQLAKALAKQLGGKFRRYPNTPTGTVCELTWTGKRWWFLV